MTRRQLSGALAESVAKYQGRMLLDPKIAERVWQIGKSVSPYDTSALIARSQYLLFEGRLDELPEIIRRLEKVAPRSSKTWIVACLYYNAIADVPKALEAARKGLATQHESDDAQIFRLILERSTP